MGPRFSLFSVDYIFLFGLTFSFIYSLSILYRHNQSNILQFESFEDLKQDIIECHVPSSDGDKSFQDERENISMKNRDPKCPIDGERLRYFDDYEIETWLHYHHVARGGRFKPIGCVPKQTVAILVPFRDRQEELEKFSLYIHQFLPDQLIDYTVYVIEQLSDGPFEGEKLINIGAIELQKLRDDVCCLVFHDVDLIPLDQRNLYMCSSRPRHLSTGISTRRYQLLYPELFEGVVAMTTKQYKSITDYLYEPNSLISTKNSIFERMIASNYEVQRNPLDLGLYMMFRHLRVDSDREWSKSSGANKTSQNYSPEIPIEAAYTLKKIELHQLYTKLSLEFI